MCKKFKCFLLIFALLLFIPSISANAETEKVVIGGEAFGLKLYCKGVMIINFEFFDYNGTNVCPAKSSGLQISDIITEVNGNKVTDNKSVEKIIRKSNGNPINLKVLRNKDNLDITVCPKLKDNKYYCVGMLHIYTCAFSLEEHYILQKWLLENFGINSDILKDKRKNLYFLSLKREAKNKFCRMIEPYVVLYQIPGILPFL